MRLEYETEYLFAPLKSTAHHSIRKVPRMLFLIPLTNYLIYMILHTD